MITDISQRDWDRVDEFREVYRQIGLSTENLPQDEVFKIIDDLYGFLGYDRPLKFYVDSPLSALISRFFISDVCKDQLEGQIGDQLWNQLEGQIWNFWYGSFYSYYACFYSFIATLGVETSKIENNLYYANELLNLGWILPYQGICIISKKPNKIMSNDFNQIHCENGPAVEYEDGYSMYCWRGIRVEKNWIESPDSITIKQIQNQQNVELRRAMIEIIGYDRYLKESNAIEIDRSQLNGQDIVLYEADFGYLKAKIVELINCTQENDGTYKHYFHRVPKTINDAHSAVAALWGLPKEKYNPTIET